MFKYLICFSTSCTLFFQGIQGSSLNNSDFNSSYQTEYKITNISFNSEQIEDGIPGIWEMWHFFRKRIDELEVSESLDEKNKNYKKGKIDAYKEVMDILLINYPFVFEY